MGGSGVVIDRHAGFASVGSTEVVITPVGSSGAIAVEGTVVRVLSFGERATAVAAAGESPEPTTALAGIAGRMAAGSDDLLLSALALHLAGAGDGAPGFATALATLAVQLGWGPSAIEALPAVEVDRLAQQLMPEPAPEVDDGWQRIVFGAPSAGAAPTASDDVAAVVAALAGDLLQRGRQRAELPTRRSDAAPGGGAAGHSPPPATATDADVGSGMHLGQAGSPPQATGSGAAAAHADHSAGATRTRGAGGDASTPAARPATPPAAGAGAPPATTSATPSPTPGHDHAAAGDVAAPADAALPADAAPPAGGPAISPPPSASPSPATTPAPPPAPVPGHPAPPVPPAVAPFPDRSTAQLPFGAPDPWPSTQLLPSAGAPTSHPAPPPGPDPARPRRTPPGAAGATGLAATAATTASPTTASAPHLDDLAAALAAALDAEADLRGLWP